MNRKISAADLISLAQNQSKKWNGEWVVSFFIWFLKSESSFDFNQRLQYLALILDNNIEFRNVFVRQWQLFFEKAEFETFWISTFSGESDSFIQEFMWAFLQKIVSTPNQEYEVSGLVDELMSFNWSLDVSTKFSTQEIYDIKNVNSILKHFPEGLIDKVIEGVRASLRKAIAILSHKNVADLYSSLFKMHFSDKYKSGFMRMHAYISADAIYDLNVANEINQENIFLVDNIIASFKESGVSLNTLFKTKKIKSRLYRIRTLLNMHHELNLQDLLLILIERKKFYSLKFQIYHYSSQLVELVSLTSAETGDHYVGRSAKEISKLFYKACGGGAVTGFTVLIKTLTAYLPFAPFMIGLLYSFNYSISFIFIALSGLSLATKQPAAVAAHLTQKWRTSNRAEFLLEIGHILRSQFWAVLGNVGVVVPVVLILCYLSSLVGGQSFMTPEKASKEIASMSVLGFTPFYAFLTGYFLWFSTFVTGAADNFFRVYELDQVMLKSPKIFSFVSMVRKRRWVGFIKNHFGVICGNVVLGLILGLVPMIGQFLGLPIDVRHVTLSSGMLAASVYTLGLDVFYQPNIYFAIVGVLLTGALNIGVSFVLSLQVAEGANAFLIKETEAKDYKNLLQTYLLRQMSRKIFFWRKS